jgi:putative membrane protein
MATSAGNLATRRIGSIFALWALITLYSAARILQIFPGKVPMLAVVALHVLPLLAFALIHGAVFYRIPGILAFVGICLVVGFVFEYPAVQTAFPFGHYYFSDLMGPKLWGIPIFLALAYVGMGYLSWMLAVVILGGVRNPISGSRVVTLPLIAAFIMVAWDLAQDPVWSTVLHACFWLNGGAYFGVPVTNFLGWYLTVYIIYQCFAFFLMRRSTGPIPPGPHYWHQAVLLYAVSAAGNIPPALVRPTPSVVADPAGVQWRVHDITAASALVSIFVMGAFAVIAWIRLAGQETGEAPGAPAITRSSSAPPETSLSR